MQISGPTGCYASSDKLWIFRSLCINTQTRLVLQSIEMAGQFTGPYKNHHLLQGLLLPFPIFSMNSGDLSGLPCIQNERRACNRSRAFYFVSFSSRVCYLAIFSSARFPLIFCYNYKVSDVVKNIHTDVLCFYRYIHCDWPAALLFELPVLVYFLSKIGLVTARFFKTIPQTCDCYHPDGGRYYHPSPDIFSQIMVSFPLLLLYEISIVVSRRVSKGIMPNHWPDKDLNFCNIAMKLRTENLVKRYRTRTVVKDVSIRG